MIFTRKILILLVLSILILYGCYSASFAYKDNLDGQSNIDYVYVGIKSPFTTNYNNYIAIWIEKKTGDEHLDIEGSLKELNISFYKEENAYFIDENAFSFSIRNIPVVVKNGHVFVNNKDITSIGNVAISKNSEIIPGGFYGL